MSKAARPASTIVITGAFLTLPVSKDTENPSAAAAVKNARRIHNAALARVVVPDLQPDHVPHKTIHVSCASFMNLMNANARPATRRLWTEQRASVLAAQAGRKLVLIYNGHLLS